METGYQRGKIQEESLYYEHKKHDGSLPIIGVNTFRNPNGDDEQHEIELARSTDDEKQSPLKRDRKSVVQGKRVSARVGLSGRRLIKDKPQTPITSIHIT